MIEGRDLVFGYRPQQPVLDRVTLELPAGLTLLLGENGSGKSTLLRAISGVLRAERGIVRIDGLDLWSQEVEARRRLAYVPDRAEVSPYASVAEILAFVGRLHGVSSERVDASSRRAGLERLGGHSVRQLSLGQRRRLMLATAMVASTPNLLLDEPLDGLDASGRAMFLEWLGERLNRGVCCVIASHEVEPFEGLIDDRLDMATLATP